MCSPTEGHRAMLREHFSLIWPQDGLRLRETDIRLRDGNTGAVDAGGADDRRSGAVKDLTYTDLAELDAGRWFDERFAGERVPT